MPRVLTFNEALAIQKALNTKARAQLEEDGHFGTLSQQALMRFQAEHDIRPADGNPSQPTLDALGIPDLFAVPAAPKLNLISLIGLIGPLLTLSKGKTMTSDQLTGVLRAILALISGYFVAKGVGNADMWNWIIAGVTGVIPFVWTWINNRPKTITPIGK